MRKIAKIHLDELIDNVIKQQNINVTYTTGVIDYLARNGYDVKYGARPLKRVIQNEIENAIVDMIANNEVREGETIKFKIANNKLHHEIVRAKKKIKIG